MNRYFTRIVLRAINQINWSLYSPPPPPPPLLFPHCTLPPRSRTFCSPIYFHLSNPSLYLNKRNMLQKIIGYLKIRPSLLYRCVSDVICTPISVESAKLNRFNLWINMNEIGWIFSLRELCSRFRRQSFCFAEVHYQTNLGKQVWDENKLQINILDRTH